MGKEVSPTPSFASSRYTDRLHGTIGDRVQFKFANLDPASFVRTFSFDIDAASPNYSSTFSITGVTLALITSSQSLL